MSAKAQSHWESLDLNIRIETIKNLAHLLDERVSEISILMADEMGKPKKQGMLEISKCVWLCDYYLKNSEQLLNEKYIETEFYKSYVTYRPIGLS